MKSKFTIFFMACSMIFSCNNNYEELEEGLYAEFNTNMGTMLIKLTYEKTPVTVANFVALAEGKHPKVDNDFKGLLRRAEINPKPLMVCSGGTSSRCTATGHWTLDLRGKYQTFNFDHFNRTVEVGAGITMAN